jgi:hypothetical protein
MPSESVGLGGGDEAQGNFICSEAAIRSIGISLARFPLTAAPQPVNGLTGSAAQGKRSDLGSQEANPSAIGLSVDVGAIARATSNEARREVSRFHRSRFDPVRCNARTYFHRGASKINGLFRVVLVALASTARERLGNW